MGKRRLVQLSGAALFIAPPLLRLGAHPLILFDLPGLKLFFFGRIFGIEDIYLLWAASGVFLFAFLLTATVLGRIWCGWGCPQTAILDLGDFLRRKIKNQAILKAIFLVLSLAVGLIFTAWFIDAGELARRLLRLRPGPWPLGSILVVGGLTFFDLTLIRRIFCRDFCPYGRIQAALSLPATMLVTIPAAETARCIDCQSCVRSCPMGIDIREGIQIACINCGECIDACRAVMARRKEAGLISYRFGDLSAAEALGNTRVLITAILLALALGALFHQATHRPGADLVVRRLATVPPRIGRNGEKSLFFDAVVRNRRQKEARFHLAVSGKEIKIAGQTVSGLLAPNEEQLLRFVLVTGQGGGEATLRLLDRQGRQMTTTRVKLPRLTNR